ncbi:MAG: hypothetical protein A2167_03760 [Planctomycetes bacterium RBG_13_46_10]|nr:MAG: hypothetical protein A2167_03760 [Planctomycetes bacterium RBG_13_46_10]
MTNTKKLFLEKNRAGELRKGLLMEEFWSQPWPLIVLSIIFSIFLTWFIGLIPVFLIRYLILRRPLSKFWSVFLASVFWLLNIVLFTLIGSHSSTHASLILVGLASYYIYRNDKEPIVLIKDIWSYIVTCGSLNYLSVFLWFRYLRKKKIVFLSITAVALSTALLIVVANLFTGFINTLEQTAVNTIGDVVLSTPSTFTKYPVFIEQVEKISSVDAATATLSSQGLLHLGKGNVRAVYIWGIEPAKRAKVTGFKKFLRRQGQLDKEPSFEVAASPEDIGGFVGIAVIAEPNEQTDEYDYSAIDKMIGEQVILTTGAIIETKGASSEGQAVGRFKRKILKVNIVDTVQTGVYDLDKGFVYLPIETLQENLYPGEKEPIANQIQIKLHKSVKPETALAEIRGAWQNFVKQHLDENPFLIRYTMIETAKQMQSQYAGELRKQMGVLLLIFGVVSFSVVVLIFCIFYMIARLKQRDIAIVKSCGAASSSVAFVFLLFGFCVGTAGSALGAVLAYIITKNINMFEEWIRIIFGLKLWKSSVYMFSEIPNNIDWWAVLPIVLFAIIAATIGTLVPAFVAARTRPVEILRYE